ncbi:hypothetical protein L083_5193 [Actinoplanes sp. N902-109]|nr:hypothetical protein L083_5193 [Actinoplanes sp. N902-109]
MALAPASAARTSPGSIEPLASTTGMCRSPASARIARHRSSPVILGMSTSLTTMSGRCARTASRAWAPSVVVITSWPARSSDRRSTNRMSSWSSATTIIRAPGVR